MTTDSSIIRLSVYRYKKSERLIAVRGFGTGAGCMVLTLSPDMSAIAQVANQRFVRRSLLDSTKYQVEVRETVVGREGPAQRLSYDLVRVLTPEDINADRWKSTASLDALPVSPEPEFTAEERLWAGEREGNIGGGILLAIVAATAFYVSTRLDGVGLILMAAFAVAMGVLMLRYEWRPSRKPEPDKLQELTDHKAQLRQKTAGERSAALTRFEGLLREKGTWDALSPKSFEFALSMRLKKEGYNVRTTQYSRDGGVDIEATDTAGLPVIVQAKQYSKNVGVSVVREMIGIRESRPDKPRTIIYALNGFTRGAKELAAQSNIELRDIRSELLSI